jgi:hypothetical protein
MITFRKLCLLLSAVGLFVQAGCHGPKKVENKNIDPDFKGFYCPGCKQGIVLE